MSYLALYRRFRPQVFEDLIGQETVVRALVNQIKTDKIGHAYLFCGARGTGKTTAAKIFARAINCEKKNGSPCGECETCLSLNDPNSLDIVEMDAASNNRVENVREIREKVQYPPVNGRFKVYIIDEVHMLTTEAFNALLKTLEEPPKHAVFILATTEPHKLPQTILSRCMRFDFKLISVQKVASLIAKIYDEVGKEYEPEAVTCIARAGEGSVRDALSVADICLSYNDGKLTYNDVIDVLGASNRQKTAELVKCIFTENSSRALQICDELCSLGKNVGMLIKDLLSFLRDVLVVKTCKDPNSILALPKEDLNMLSEIASLQDGRGILRAIEIFSKTENEVKYSTHPKIIFEASIVKASNQSADYNIDALMSRITKLENALSGGGFKKAEIQTITTVTDNSAQEKIEKLSHKIDQLEKKLDENLNKISVKQSEEKTLEKETKVEVLQPVKETVEPKKIEKPAVRKSRQERLNDELSSLIPPEEDFSISFSQEDYSVFDKKEEVATKKAENSEVETAKVEENKKEHFSTVPDRRVWGTLIKKLRETGNTMLWVICQELEGEVSNGVLTIKVATDKEKEVITKENNMSNLKKVLGEICSYSIVVKMVGDTSDDDGFEKDVEKLKVDFDKLDIED